MNQMYIALITLVFYSIVCIPASFANNNYTPRLAEPILESNAWTTIESLPNDQVNNMTVDQHNTLWLGAPNGIVHYNGKDIVRYDKDDGLPTGLIYHVKESRAGNMLALSRRQMFELNNGRWQKFGPAIVPNLPYQGLKKFIELKGDFWFIHNNNLVALNKTQLRHFPLQDEIIESFVIDQKGYFWLLGKGSGTVKVFSWINQQFTLVQHWPSLVDLNNEPAQISALNNGEVWVLTEHNEQVPIATNSYALHNKTNNNNSNNNKLAWEEKRYPTKRGYSDKAIKMLPNGHIVIANHKQMVVKTPNYWLIKNLKRVGIENTVSNITRSNDGAIWLLEKNNGVKRLNYTRPKQIKYRDIILGCTTNSHQYFIHKNGDVIQHDPQLKTWHKFEPSPALITTPNNILCTKDNTIIIYGADQQRSAISYRADTSDVKAPWQKIIFENHGVFIGQYAALETKNGDIYLGNNDEKHRSLNLLVKLNKAANNKYQVTYFPIAQRISSIAELPDSKIALGAFNLNILENGVKTRLRLPDHLLSNWIEDLRIDTAGHLWVATWDYGIFKHQEGRWVQLSVNAGLSNNRVSSLLPLEQGRMLALTSSGVDRFDGKKWQATDIKGVGSIREGSNLVQTSDKALWVNQASRDWMFRAQDSATANAEALKSSSDDFYTVKYLPNKLAPIVQAFIEKPTDKQSDSVLITWQAQDQWFETPSDKLQYSYRLNDDEWSPFSIEKSSYFNKLSAGDYVFEVRARDGDSNISVPATIAFSIHAALWQQPWFLNLVIAMAVIILLLLFLLVAQRLKATSKLNEDRLQFLTNISHELRNPLALVITPLEDLASKNNPANINTGLELALRNAKRLKQLIDQLLEYRRLHAGHTQLTEQDGDLISFLKLAINDFTYIAQSKKQTLVFNNEFPRYLCRFDHDVVRKIIDNLLSNAIKYSPENTEITLVFAVVNKEIIISVEDQGIGISSHEQKSIFNPFYTPLHRSFGNENSFGIGLAFVKDLVSLCQGSIHVESPPKGKKHGSAFTLRFPFTINEVPQPKPTILDEPSLVSDNDEGKIKLLLVDDNTELVLYLKDALSNDFDCHIEFDGGSGLQYATTHIPDVIISDVRMPKMDGLALCKALKANLSTSHIPVLLHSAVISEQHQLSGLAVGAVDYLPKPASIELIRSRVKNLMNDREQFAEHLHQDLLSQNKNKPAEPVAKTDTKVADKTTALDIDSEAFTASLSDTNLIKFIEQIKHQVQQHYSDSEFNAEKLAEALFMSRSAFYRKFKALTNITPAEYIKVYRLNQAATSLLQGESVALVSEKSGYSEASSFNRAFKNHFGCAPSKYK